MKWIIRIISHILEEVCGSVWICPVSLYFLIFSHTCSHFMAVSLCAGLWSFLSTDCRSNYLETAYRGEVTYLALFCSFSPTVKKVTFASETRCQSDLTECWLKHQCLATCEWGELSLGIILNHHAVFAGSNAEAEVHKLCDWSKCLFTIFLESL